ncbi:MAG: hypothetical protein E3J54_01650 [Actinobacteria bacterium]|nr:MAG: hypothetical protein E3J54_01650 [Actinomycetota bacterium]
MLIDGRAKLDRRTKNLVKRLRQDDIAIIDHEDVDRVTAEALLATGVKVVLNKARFSSGRYPNTGPLLLIKAGLLLIDDIGPKIFNSVSEGDRLMVKEDAVFKDGEKIANGDILSQKKVESILAEAKNNVSKEIDKFAVNTLSYVQKEKGFVTSVQNLPDLDFDLTDRHCLIVVRGYDYKDDLKMLRPYIRDVRPILIGVDGGADAILAEGLKPDIIIGDMDSASDKALRAGRQLIVHAYKNGQAPGIERIKKLDLNADVLKAAGTSEDIAMLLAYEKGAELLVLVGSHANLVEFLDKGREGMASTFLMRLKVGDRLVDAKGVSKLYQAKAKFSYLIILLAAAMVAVLAIIFTSPNVRNILNLIFSRIQLTLGF